MNKSFETLVKGKWILAGEHTVLRGGPALVFPLTGKSLRFSYQVSPPNQELNLTLQGDNGEELKLLIWGVIERACELKKVNRSQLKGSLTIHSNIPIGAGLGASAALCVAVARWFENEGYVKREEVYEFARQLENLFHGESSGVDIAVALTGKPTRFVKNGSRDIVEQKWTPRWFLSYSGKRGVTLDCVNKVKELHVKDPELANKIDQDMKMAVAMAEEALKLPESKGLPYLVKAIDMACICFEKWGLTSGLVNAHLDLLVHHGALAVKPTGSGDGGYVLSLWNSAPPVELLADLIPCY